MAKEKRMLSLLGLNKNMEGLFRSYCHLLKKELKDHWVIDTNIENTEVAIVSEYYNGNIEDCVIVKIILHESSSSIVVNNVMTITYPLTSHKIVGILNQTSNINTLNQSKRAKVKQAFSFKNIFSKFMSDNKQSNLKKHKTIKTKSQKVANQLMNLRYGSSYKALKVVFLGRPGSGKTTAIKSVGGDSALTSEVVATDSVGLTKSQTTIGIDYNEYTCQNGTKLRLYGTPGQVRYDYVQNQTVANADIYIILIDLSSVAPYAEFLHYKKLIESAGNDKAINLVAFTHYDLKEHNMASLSKEIRKKCHGEILTAKVDTRKADEVRFMLENVTMMKVNDTPPQQYYAENSLFLKNVNTTI